MYDQLELVLFAQSLLDVTLRLSSSASAYLLEKQTLFTSSPWRGSGCISHGISWAGVRSGSKQHGAQPRESFECES